MRAPASQDAAPLPDRDRLPDPRVDVLRRRLEGLLGIPATEGNDLTVLVNGDQIFPAMLEAVRGAQRTVDFLTFVYWKGEIAHVFAHALADRASAGVRVRVLIDAIGGRLIDRELIEHMARCGVQVEWFRVPPWQGAWISPFKLDHRTHRKVLVVDQRTAFTGGVGIAEEWCGDARDESEWRDTHVRVVGPAVDGLAAAFAQDWAETGAALWEDVDRFPEHAATGSSVVQVARGSATVGWNDVATTFRILMESAETHLRMMTAYFVPDEGFLGLLTAAAARGVRVQVMLPGPHADKRVCQLASEAVYRELVQGGVEVWAFQPSMLHAKVMTVDGIAAVVGSANMNRRSMSHDDEVVMTVLDPVVARRLEDDFDAELRRCVQVDPQRWEDRSLRQKAEEKASSLLRHWF